jgi:putative endonuclease
MSSYSMVRFVYVEGFVSARDATARECLLRAWRRAKKVAMIEAPNPQWKGLAEGFGFQPL